MSGCILIIFIVMLIILGAVSPQLAANVTPGIFVVLFGLYFLRALFKGCL